jgi:hypothetical protein
VQFWNSLSNPKIKPQTKQHFLCQLTPYLDKQRVSKGKGHSNTALTKSKEDFQLLDVETQALL